MEKSNPLDSLINDSPSYVRWDTGTLHLHQHHRKCVLGSQPPPQKGWSRGAELAAPRPEPSEQTLQHCACWSLRLALGKALSILSG